VQWRTKKPTGQIMQDPQRMDGPSSSDHQFWAREFLRLALKQAEKKGVPSHTMAQLMLVQAWMLFTGQSEQDASKTVKTLFLKSMADKFGASPPDQ
jgi:hypothetical protein